MKTIYKYPLQITDIQDVLLPAGAQLLTVQTQDDCAQLWALVDPSVDKTEKIQLSMYGTGHPIFTSEPGRHLSTIQLQSGRLVFHVFAYQPV